MHERHIKIIIAMLSFLFLDMSRPLGYTLHTEFVVLGLVFAAFNYSFFVAFLLSVVFGFFKDAVGISPSHFNLMIMPLLTILIHLFLRRFHKVGIRIAVFFTALVIYAVNNSLQLQTPEVGFTLLFIVQSAIIFLGINYLLRKWIRIFPVKYI